MDRYVGGKHVVTRPGTAYVCAIHDGETMQDALARFARDAAWCERELGDVPHETIGGWRSAAGTRTPWFSDCIPVESLGRDA